jgi:hypothetical protein
MFDPLFCGRLGGGVRWPVASDSLCQQGLLKLQKKVKFEIQVLLLYCRNLYK